MRLQPIELSRQVVSELDSDLPAIGSDEGTQAAHADTELMHALGVLPQARAAFIRPDMPQAGLRDRHEGEAPGHVGADRDRPGPLRLRRLVQGQPVAAGRLGVVFPGNGYLAVQHQRRLHETPGSSRFQLELDLADRQTTLTGPHLAQVEGDLDLALMQHDRPNRALQLRREHGGQGAGNALVLKPGLHILVGDLRQIGNVAPDVAFDLPQRLQAGLPADRKLDRLNAALSEMPDAQRGPCGSELISRRVEVDAQQAAGSAAAARQRAQRRRALHFAGAFG